MRLALLRVAAWTFISVWSPSAFSDRPAAAPSNAVYLQPSACFVSTPGADARGDGEPLLREIQRQSLLIAARDELGLVTRDAWLGDAMPTAGQNEPFEIDRANAPRAPLEVRRGFFPAKRTVGRRDLMPVLPTSGVDPRQWLVDAERLSRTFYVRTLETCGFRGRANRRSDAAGVPEEIQAGLSEMVFIPQLLAVRQLHELVRCDGQSPARLGALVRGYANLGMLTEFHRHPAHKVFKARALLYAQRMATQGADPAYALWHRAYAFAAAGLHRLAIEDIKAAEGRSPPGAARPAWVGLIDAHCRFALDRLSPEKADPSDKQLAGLLWYLAVELGGDDGMTVIAGSDLVKEMPECYRIHAGVCRHSGSAAEDGMFTEWLATAGKTIYRRLAAVPDLPGPALSVAQEHQPNDAADAEGKEYESRAKLAQALGEEAAADAGEPSWACLGRLMAELSFVQASERIRFETSILDTSAEEFVKLSGPLMAGHAGGGEVRDQPAAARPDQTAGDLSALISRLDKRDRGRAPAIRALMAVSPFSPLAKTAAIEQPGDEFRDLLGEWERSAADCPQIAKALAHRATDEARWDDVIAWSKTAIAASPDLPTYLVLANAYWRRGRSDLWVATLQDYLNQPDYGLWHSQACALLARHFMGRKDWKKAVRYAEAAAESASPLGMGVLAECCEGNQRWKAVEQIRKDAADHDSEHGGTGWYFFCRRTGQGDFVAAQAASWQAIESESFAREEPITVAAFLLLERHPEKARPLLAGEFARRGSPIVGLWLAIVEDGLKHPRPRDAVLAKLRQAKAEPEAVLRDHGRWSDPKAGSRAAQRLYDPAILELVRTLIADLSAGGRGKLDLAAADRTNDARKAALRASPLANDDRPIWFDYLLGKYLSLHGKKNAAVERWKRCVAETENFCSIPRTLAAAELCDRGVPPESYQLLWEKSVQPAGKSP